MKLGKVTVFNPFAGILVMGGAGSGKSATLIEPIIKEAGRLKYSGLLYDFKFPTLSNQLESAYKNSGIELRYVNFYDLSRSHRINPLNPQLIPTLSHAKEYASALYINMKPDKGRKLEPYWDTNAMNIITAIIWYLKKTNPNHCNLPMVIALILSGKTDELLSCLSQDRESAGMIATILHAKSAQSGDLSATIMSSLTNYISILNSREIFWVLNGDEINVDVNNKEKPCMLALGNNPSLQDTYSPLIGLIITVCTKLMNQPNKHQSILIIDEFPTIYAPKIETIPATGRSNKICTCLCAQDTAQVIDSYGQEKTETIISNLGSQFYFRTSNPKTAERVVKLFGKEDQVIINTSKNRGYSDTGSNSGRSTSYNIQERDKVKIQDVLNLPTGNYYALLSAGYKNNLMLVDGSIKNYKENNDVLAPFKTVSDYDLTANFEKIHRDAESILEQFNL